MGRLGIGALSALCSLLAAACGQSDDRAPIKHFDGGGASGGFGGGGLGGSAGSDGGECTPDPQLGSTLSGNMITYDVLLSDKQPFPGQAEIEAPGANCPFVKAGYDGAASGVDGGQPKFLLESVKKDAELYTHVYQLPSSSEPVYPTLILIDATTDRDEMDGFGMVRSVGVDEAYTAVGVTRDPTKGTIIVQLLAPLTNAPQAGGEVDVGGAGSTVYPATGSWTLGGQTDPSGIAVLLNTTAVDYPGQTLMVNVKLGTLTKSLECRSASGAVTICWIGIGTA